MNESISLKMQVESSRKNAPDPATTTSNDAKRPRLSSQLIDNGSNDGDSFNRVPKECRLRILGFLNVQDLAEAAFINRLFTEDCRHSSLPQTREVTIYCDTHRPPGRYFDEMHNFIALLKQLYRMNKSGKFARFTMLKLVRHQNLDKLSIGVVRSITKGVLLRDVTTLDLSLPPNLPHKQANLRATIPKALALLMPNLRDVDMSHTRVSQSALSDFAKKCPLLSKITWHSQSATSAFLSGQDLKTCKNLKEIYMDDSLFYGSEPDHVALLCNEDGPSCIFCFCHKQLERVSLKNAKLYCDDEAPKVVPQSALLKFARCAPNLRWFRSDLTEENIAILQAQRPEVTFT
jgi:hypothetical protein